MSRPTLHRRCVFCGGLTRGIWTPPSYFAVAVGRAASIAALPLTPADETAVSLGAPTREFSDSFGIARDP